MFNYIFGSYLNVPYQLVSNLTDIPEGQQTISYKDKLSNSLLHFEAHDLLFQKGIGKQAINCFEHNNHAAFFEIDSSRVRSSALAPRNPWALRKREGFVHKEW